MKPALLVISALAVPATTPSAQAVKQVRLAEPARSFPEPFSNVTGLRQLDDGRLVVADRLEQTVRFLDIATGAMQDIGRPGSGPGEYQMPGGLLPLPGDSTLLIDFGNMRMAVVSPSGRITRSTPLMREAGFVRPTAADASGGLYYDQSGVRISRGGAIETADTAPIQRMDFSTEEIETVANLPLPEPGQGSMRSVSSSGGSFQIRGGIAAYPMQSTWSAAPDGRIAIVHADPYHVEWITPGGAARSGPTVSYEPVGVTDNDKEAWADRLGGGGAMMIAMDGGAGRSNRTMNMPRPDTGDMEWPETKPPFPRQAARVTPDGELWVERHVAFGQPAAYDVFNDAGERVRQIVFPEGRRLVGFGRGVVYLVNVDADDLQWLEEYAIER